eukprot:s601_g17.t1
MARASHPISEVWRLLRESKQQDLAPILIRNGVKSVEDISRLSAQLLADGVPAWKIELVTAVHHQEDEPPRPRWDMPVVRPTKRASLQAAIDAALPNNRRRCVEALERDVLANSTKPSTDSKVKTYQTICLAWQVEPWPVTLRSIQCFGASLKEGAYKSAQGFFQAVFTYQRRHLQQDVDALVRGAARDYTRSIARGLGPSSLKDSFDVDLLSEIGIEYQAAPFDLHCTSHGRDVMVLACWFMMRELEIASCTWSHLYVSGPTINLMLPVQKNDTAGSLTLRTLRCACRIRLHPLCPVHAAQRHLSRLRAHVAFQNQADFPVVPNDEGQVLSKHLMVQFFRRTIAAAGVSLTRPNHEGAETERFAGHVCRVSGAQWLSRLGMPLNQIQLLGRWSSTAVERYVQLAPLTQIEQCGADLLRPAGSGHRNISNDDVMEEPPLHPPMPVVNVEELDKPVEVDDGQRAPERNAEDENSRILNQSCRFLFHPVTCSHSDMLHLDQLLPYELTLICGDPSQTGSRPPPDKPYDDGHRWYSGHDLGRAGAECRGRSCHSRLPECPRDQNDTDFGPHLHDQRGVSFASRTSFTGRIPEGHHPTDCRGRGETNSPGSAGVYLARSPATMAAETCSRAHCSPPDDTWDDGTSELFGNSQWGDKAPKTLPAQIWQKQVSRYNAVTIEGRPRRFPEREVLGAEQVLGRMWFEHTTTKSYTPTGLGEILQKRSFTASGDVNPLQKQTKSVQLLRIEDDCLVQDEEGKSWTPRSILAVLDGVNSIRWAWVLLQIGEEDHIHTFAEWFIQKVRGRANKLENMRAFWDAIGWKMAMSMRSGQSFGEASVEVMADVDLLNECMSRDMTKDTKPNQPKKRPATEDNGGYVSRQRTGAWQPSSNSKGAKGNQKGKQSFAQWSNSAEVEVLAPVGEKILSIDPEHKCIILITDGTPCPDFSVVVDRSEGRHLPEGSKFSAFIDKVEELEKTLTQHTFLVVAENVVMNDPSDAKFISDRLGTEPVVIDSSDASYVSRPRLWWLRLKWQDVKVNPLTEQRLHWSQHNGYRKIKMDLPQQSAHDFTMGGMAFHDDVIHHRRHILCFTTPSPDPAGRPPPKRPKLKTTEEARQRWLSDSRQFAPWQYSDHAMVWRGEEASVIPPCLKEELHGMPRGWSRLPNIPHRSRHRMIANGWHMYAAVLALALLLQSASATVTSMPQTVGSTTLQKILAMGNNTMARPGPGTWHQKGIAVPPCSDMWHHWKISTTINHPTLVVPDMDPGMQATFDLYRNLWPQLNEIREGVVQDLDKMIQDWDDITQQWYEQLPVELQSVYTTNNKKPVTQIPVLLELLQQCGHEGSKTCAMS